MTQLSQIGILPVLLIALGGLLVLRSAEPEKAQQRFLRYLLLVGSMLLLALLVSIQMTPLQDNRPFWQVSTVMMPAIIAVLALILLHARQIKIGGRATQLWVLLLLLGLAGLIAYWRFPLDLAYSILPGVAVLVLGWLIGRRFRRTAVLLAILLFLALLGLNLMQTIPASNLPPLPQWAQIIVAPVIIGAPSLLVVTAAVLITNGLQCEGRKRPFLLITLAVGLLGSLAYATFWSSVWDQTSDGLGGLFLSSSSSVVAMGAGMVMAIKLTGWQRVTGLLFAIVAPLLLLLSFEWGWQVSYHDLTESRAERITQALASYHQREGAYPQTLEALTPRDLLYLPQPVEIQGETWCYQGGTHFYRLGAFYREFFSMPVELQVYVTEGEPDSEWTCAGQLASMKERYYSPMEDPAAMQPIPPTPLPPNDVAQAGEMLEPLLGENNMVWGSWSPDSAYFLLGQRDDTGGVTFSFLNGKTGELCTIPGTYPLPPFAVNLRSHHAWLPDGQLLLLDGEGFISIMTPCSPSIRSVMPKTSETIIEMMTQDEGGNGRLLFKTASEFWIFNGLSLTWRLIPNVTPNPYEAHWDNAAWQPDGKLLAISRLNGRDARDGSTLFIINGDSGQVIHTLSLDEASDQSSPRVDWLRTEELLLGGSGVLRILDISTAPPQSTDVIAEIFGLDLDFPDEVWGNGWEVDWENDSYILTLQANHPRNQALYLYRSATGMVDVYDEMVNLLLLFPDGQVEQWTKPELESAQKDIFVLIDVVSGEVHSALTIGGHTPRDYPRLSLAYLAESDQLIVASSQGISRHDLPTGRVSDLWTLAGTGFAPFLRLAPDGSAVVAVRDQGGIYWLPLR
ncbi:MAG: hypothetical protein H6657_09265 [Ardenticatenaceae bacterium]|nr:hypothetical protein [Ardenticatenaceae bacterium]